MTRDYHFPALWLVECVSGPPLSLEKLEGTEHGGKKRAWDLRPGSPGVPVISAAPNRERPATGVGFPSSSGGDAGQRPSFSQA